MSESDSKSYSMRREYLTYLIRQSLDEGAWVSSNYNQELANSLFSHLIVMTHHCHWVIIQEDGETRHDLAIEIGTSRREGFSEDEVALLVWSIGAILKRRNWFTIQDDENDEFIKDKLGASGLNIYLGHWADEFNDPTPFAGNSVAHAKFRELEGWWTWTDLTIRLNYDAAFDDAYGTNTQIELKLLETDLEFDRTDPGRFVARAFIERLESNFEFNQEGKKSD